MMVAAFEKGKTDVVVPRGGGTPSSSSYSLML